MAYIVLVLCLSKGHAGGDEALTLGSGAVGISTSPESWSHEFCNTQFTVLPVNLRP
jgi:hypothetical protein